MLATSRTPPKQPGPSAAGPAALTGGARVDVCIVAGGLAELIAAYYLAQEKRGVMLLHDGPIGGYHSALEMAHLGTAIEPGYAELEALHGVDNARLAAQSYAAALDALEAIVRRERIACEFERLDGYRFCTGANAFAEASAEVEAAHRAGAREVEIVASAPIESTRSGPCVRYPGQMRFHPLKLLEGLTRSIAHQGGRVHVGVAARAVEPGRPATLVTSGGHRIEADLVVTPAVNGARRTAAHAVGMRVARGSVARALYWNRSSPLRCARLRSAGSAEMLLVAGEDTPEALAAWAQEHFPVRADAVQHFQGELPVAADVFALTGLEACDSASVCVSAASWGSAATRAVVAGMAIRDFIIGARVPEGEAPAHADHFALARELS